MKKLTSLLFTLLVSMCLSAQNDYNLVPNWSFEILDDKVKNGGAIGLADPWTSITMNPVDLFSSKSKVEDYGVPFNKYGEENARTGENYAGVTFYGYRGKSPRTYIGTRLEKPLEEGKDYCVKFHISMSDMSKYAVNNIGLLLTDEQITEMSDANLYYEPHIISVTNRVYRKQFSWEAVCGTITAEGGEEYLIIGNFSYDDETKQETVRLSKEFSGRQNSDGYYFIDDVSVIPSDKIGEKDCACEKIAGGQLKVEYKKFGTDINEKRKATTTYLVNSDGSKAGEKQPEEEEKVETKEEGGTVYKKFDSSPKEVEKKVEVKKPYSPADVVIYYEDKLFKAPEGDEDVEKLITYLKKNTKVKIQLEGHADPSEAEVKLLGKRRAILLYKKLSDSGVAKERLKYVGIETSKPASKDDASKNRRVTISLQ